MPTVGLYGAPKVATAPLPGARLTQAQTPESEGAGLDEAKAQGAEALAGLGGSVARAGVDMIQLQTQAALEARNTTKLASANALYAAKQLILNDPETGYLNTLGADASSQMADAFDKYDTAAGKIAAGLSTDADRKTFEQTLANDRNNFTGDVLRHRNDQARAYAAREQSSFEVNTQNDALSHVADTRQYFQNLNDGITSIRTTGPHLGLGPEEIQQQVDAFTSSTHVKAIDALLAQGQTVGAKVLFEEVSAAGQIKGDAAEKIQKAIAEGTLRKQAQQKADEILAAGGTLADQRAKVKALDDPDLRDAVDQRIEHEAALAASAQRANEEQMLSDAYATVGRTGNVAAIPPSQWTALGTHQPGLIEYADKLTKGEPIQTDPVKYYALMQEASDTPEDFVKTNLLPYRNSLDNATFKQLTDLQYSIRKGDRENADKVLGGFRTNVQIVDDSLTSYGMDPNSKDPATKSAIAELRRMLDTRVQAQESLTGKKPTNDDIQTNLDAILSQTRTTPGSWWGLVPFNGVSFSSTSKRLIELTPADVPAADRTQIEDSLRRHGLPVSDATVLDVYINHQAGRK
jgi:hypothetical protein